MGLDLEKILPIVIFDILKSRYVVAREQPLHSVTP
jgi:hypothetical protein